MPDSGAPWPDSAVETVSGRLAGLAKQFGARIALSDLAEELSFAELVGRIDAVAGAVEAALPRHGSAIALLAPLDCRFYVAFLGVLRAGRVALVLDPEHPADRLRLVTARDGAEAILATEELAEAARAIIAPGTPLLTVEAAVSAQRQTVGEPQPEAPAYVLYTSGSTGEPKGVIHSHANAINDAVINGISPGFTPEDVSAVYYPGTMGTIRNGLGILLAGGQLHVLPARRLGVGRLVEEIRRRRLTVIQGVPTIFRRVAETASKGPLLETVRVVRLIGDRSHWSDLDLARQACGPEVQLQVSIGSTECSSTFATWTVDEALRTPGARLPVGRPPPGVSVSLLDELGAPARDGEPGEAIVSSRRLALGYWRQPELTKAAFGKPPQDEDLRTFATGDICVRRPDGLFEFIGRKDAMLKIRGHRLEPGEVEAALRLCPGLDDAAVVVRRDPEGRPTALAAYAEKAPDAEGLLPRHVLAVLSQKLPAYMMPAVLYLQPLPRLANFKPDRLALKAADQAHRADRRARASDPLLDEVAKVFETVVGCRGATGEDDLLSLGGDSLQSVQLMLELESRFGVKLRDAAFRRRRNIADLTAWIRRRMAPVS